MGVLSVDEQVAQILAVVADNPAFGLKDVTDEFSGDEPDGGRLFELSYTDRDTETTDLVGALSYDATSRTWASCHLLTNTFSDVYWSAKDALAWLLLRDMELQAFTAALFS